MALSTRNIADNASFQAFMNAYLREIDPGVWHSSDNWRKQTGLTYGNNENLVLELQLTELNSTLAVGVSYYSLAGRHTLTDVFQKQQNQWSWEPLDKMSAILLLINNIYACHSDSNNMSSDQLELVSRIIESHQIMHHYLQQRENDLRLLSNNFIDSEQSLLFGHWLHPTPKSRQGMHAWQHQNYAPELKARFQLHFFAVDRHLIRQGSILEQSAEDIVQQILNLDTDQNRTGQTVSDSVPGKVLIPVHPLQAQWLLHQDYIQQLIADNSLNDLGPMGASFTPTSSVRTLYCEELDYMVKLSIPVKITNSLRNNMAHELNAGLYVSNLIRNSNFSDECPTFAIIGDPAYMTVTLDGRQESGFEVIFRENPFTQTQPDVPRVISVAALVQEPATPASQSRLAETVNALAEKQNISVKAASLMWFDHYWECAIESAIKLYDRHGIALEAHQQNSLLDITDNYPAKYYYRDNQGFYLSEHLRTKLLQQEPNLTKTQDLFYEDGQIHNRFSYYLIINQLFSVINRFGLDDLISETELLHIAQQKLRQLQPDMQNLGKQFIQSVLEVRNIPFKGNLLTRVEDIDELQADQELAVYTTIRNPLYDFTAKAKITTPADQEVYLESA